MISATKPKSSAFFREHPVFTTREYQSYLSQKGSTNSNTSRNLLQDFHKRGVIGRIRRGLYCSVPPGTSPQSYPVDSYLIASRLAPDAILAYHTALELQGRSYSIQNRIYYLSRLPAATTTFRFRGVEFRPVRPPISLIRHRKQRFGVVTVDRSGLDIQVTSLERTLVDVLDRPDLSGGWEEVWRSLESVPYLDLDDVVEYANLLGKRKTAALVGFFLEQHARSLSVSPNHLAALEKLRPKELMYVNRTQRDQKGRALPRWNIVVPIQILNKSWEEPT